VAKVLDDVTDQEACFQRLFNHFGQPGAWRCEPDTDNILAHFAKQRLVLGMASNYDSRLRMVTAGKPELAAIEHLCISSEIGWRKPAPEFFATVCQSVGLPAKQILFVGDDPMNDIVGAQMAGMTAVLFDPAGRYPPNQLKIDKLPIRISELTDLLALLRN
jgi:putative hydrolase of the HAD superfamily